MVAASAVLLALLSGIVVMMLGAVGHMARMTSPGLANLGSPAARERHLAERRNSAGGSPRSGPVGGFIDPAGPATGTMR